MPKVFPTVETPGGYVVEETAATVHRWLAYAMLGVARVHELRSRSIAGSAGTTCCSGWSWSGRGLRSEAAGRAARMAADLRGSALRGRVGAVRVGSRGHGGTGKCGWRRLLAWYKDVEMAWTTCLSSTVVLSPQRNFLHPTDACRSVGAERNRG